MGALTPLGCGVEPTWQRLIKGESSARKVDHFVVFAMCAARQALDDAGWMPKTYDEQTRTGVVIGSGIGGIEGIADTAITLHEKGPRRVSPFFIPGRIINL